MFSGLFFRRKKLLTNPKLLGRWGEKRAAKYLNVTGFRTIARNYRCPGGEIDIVAMDNDGAVVFVEVKTRRDERHAQAHRAVGYRKQQRMIKAARHFAARYKIKDRPMRFDVIAVVLGEKNGAAVRHYRNVFVP